MSEYEVNDLDRQIWEEELDDFVPQKVLDVHTHLFRWAFDLDPNKATGPFANGIGKMFPEVTWELADEVDAALMPGREIERLVLPYPFPLPVDHEGMNAYTAAETAKGGGKSRSLMLVTPDMTAEHVEAVCRKYGHVGFKPYRWYAPNAVEGRLTDFMPEHQIAVADKLGLIILMHLSRRDGIADPLNIEDMIRLSDKYPNVKWNLAHCARSYAPWMIEKAAPSLRGLHNVWYDTSTVCDSDAIAALYDGVGIERVMYGGDDMIGPMKGKYVTFGKAWAYVSPYNHSMSLVHCDGRMTFTRYEQLRAMKRAARGITQSQKQALFYDTARAFVDSVKVPEAQ